MNEPVYPNAPVTTSTPVILPSVIDRFTRAAANCWSFDTIADVRLDTWHGAREIEADASFRPVWERGLQMRTPSAHGVAPDRAMGD